MQRLANSTRMILCSILLLPIHAFPASPIHVEVPNVNGSDATGWESMPHIPGAFAHSAWSVDASSEAVMAVYQTNHQNPAAITRAVIMSSGKLRDCWSHWVYAYNALNAAAAKDWSIRTDSVSIMAPCWFSDKDLAAGAAKAPQLIFPAGGWMNGEDNIGPASIKNFSTLNALDGLAAHYMNHTLYPKMKTVVVAGHSAGGQLTQRYATLRQDTTNNGRLQFWIANPASYAWLTSDRPDPDDACTGVDDYKYGLGGNLPEYAAGLEREDIISQYRARNVHYLLGTADHETGDSRCQATVQGPDHLGRGQNFVKMLQGMEGGMPRTHDLAYVNGVGHDAEGMIGSVVGRQKLFKSGWSLC